MKELNYFRRAIDNAVGAWVVDTIQETGSLHQGTAAMMQKAREHLLAQISLLEYRETPLNQFLEHKPVFLLGSLACEVCGCAEDHSIHKGEKSDA